MYWVRILVGSNVCHRGCTHAVLQTVQRPGLHNAVYGAVHNKEPLKTFDKRRAYSRLQASFCDNTARKCRCIWYSLTLSKYFLALPRPPRHSRLRGMIADNESRICHSMEGQIRPSHSKGMRRGADQNRDIQCMYSFNWHSSYIELPHEDSILPF